MAKEYFSDSRDPVCEALTARGIQHTSRSLPFLNLSTLRLPDVPSELKYVLLDKKIKEQIELLAKLKC